MINVIRLRLKSNEWQEAQEFIFQQSQFFEEELDDDNEEN